MDSGTGIIYIEDNRVPLDTEKEKLIPIKPFEVTKKQKKNKQVSKHDNRSILGKKFTTARKSARRR